MNVIEVTVSFQLRELMGFCHVVRQVYGRQLVWSKLHLYIEALPAILTALREQVGKFLDTHS
jgi:hypothetical protein